MGADTDLATEEEAAERTSAGRSRLASNTWGDWAMVGLSVLMVVLVLLRPRLTALVDDHDALAAWLTVFVSIGLQSLPFLVLGVVLAAAIAVLVPADALTRWLPRRPAAAVPVAGLSGLVLPGCECASVPIAGSLVTRGVLGRSGSTHLVTDPVGRPTTPWAVRRAISSAKAADPRIPSELRFHDLRHYFASLLIGHGLDIKVVQTRLRHASVTTTLNTYGHLWPDADESARAAVGKVLATRADNLRTIRAS